MDKVIQLVIAALHGVVIQRIALRLRIALAILLTGVVATLHHFALSRGWIAGDINDLVHGPVAIANKWAQGAYGAIGGVFFVSVTGKPDEYTGLVPGIAIVPPSTPITEKPDNGRMVGVVLPPPKDDAPELLTRLK